MNPFGAANVGESRMTFIAIRPIAGVEEMIKNAMEAARHRAKHEKREVEEMISNAMEAAWHRAKHEKGESPPQGARIVQ